MYTIETAIVVPVLLFMILICISISLKYTEMMSAYATACREAIPDDRISNTDAARAGDILYEVFQKYSR